MLQRRTLVRPSNPGRVPPLEVRVAAADGVEFPICGVAVDDMLQYGIATWQKFAIPGAGVHPSRVDTTGGAAWCSTTRASRRCCRDPRVMVSRGSGAPSGACLSG
jgi:hypothetical protein